MPFTVNKSLGVKMKVFLEKNISGRVGLDDTTFWNYIENERQFDNKSQITEITRMK